MQNMRVSGALEDCEFAGCASFWGFDDLVWSIAGVKLFIGAKFDLKKKKIRFRSRKKELVFGLKRVS